MSNEKKTSDKQQGYASLTGVSGSYMVNRMKDIIDNPKPLKEPPYNCPSTGDIRVGNGCSYPNCMCEWYL